MSDAKREAVNQWFTNTLLSRFDNRATGRIVIIMQRLHMDDLVGAVTKASDSWTVLNLPAIAEYDAHIQIGPNKYHFRKQGDLLHPARESQEMLDELKRDMGSDFFSAQYQQNPLPPGGGTIKRHWVVRGNCPTEDLVASQILQSWDTASKDGPDNDWSVCTTWRRTAKGKNYLLDVLRVKLNYPSLKARALEHARHWNATSVLVEDAGTGTALIAELRNAGIPAIGVKPGDSKVVRMSIHSAKFEAGLVIFPESAPWLPDLEVELFAFPKGLHDDQVDSISQALAWRRRNIGVA